VCAEGAQSQGEGGREGGKVTLFSYHVAGQQIDLSLPLVDCHDTHISFSLSHTQTADTALYASLEETFNKVAITNNHRHATNNQKRFTKPMCTAQCANYS
jgi:hypothetical protein